MKVSWTWNSGGRELKGKPALRLILLVLGVLLVGALLLDLRGAMRKRQEELRRLAALEQPEALMPGLDDTRYVDAQGRFAITLPTPWLRLSGIAADPYTAVFRGPRRIEISVVVTPLNHDRFDLLLAQIRAKMETLDLRFSRLNTVTFQGRPAVEREAILPRSRVYALDFLEGPVGHHILVSIPHEEYERLLPIVKEMLQTYEAPAGPRARADAVGTPAPVANPSPPSDALPPGPSSSESADSPSADAPQRATPAVAPGTME